jgi:acetyl esterase/lipase
VETIIYKQVDGCSIAADIYPAAGADPAPVLLWIHGGALITGSRSGIPKLLLEEFTRAGFALVAIDYRLAPETKLPAIVEDVEAAARWVRGPGAERFGFDPNRLAILGASAGGYLTLLLGARLTSRPQALVSFFGYGDIVGDWYLRPDPFYRSQGLIPAELAESAVGTEPVSAVENPEERGRFYRYCRQRGTWPLRVTGMDPARGLQPFHPFCPERNLTPYYPPTLLLHGDADTDVPYAQSVAMAAALDSAGVKNELLTIPDGPHGYINTTTRDDYESANPTPAAKSLHRTLAFLKDKLPTLP